METNSAVAPDLSGALPSSTFAADTINTILSLFIKSAATLEEIADRAEVSIPAVLRCLEEQKPFLRNLLETLDLRVRLLASRAEAIAIEALNEIVLLADDKEACRKAASKLLSHFKRPPAPSPRSAGRRAPSPQGEGDEGPSTIAPKQQPESQRTPSAWGNPVSHAPTYSCTIAHAPAPSPLHAEGVEESSRGVERAQRATPPESEPRL